MISLALTKEVSGNVNQICDKVTEAIKPYGFGILTRIEFDQKIKEKLGEEIKPCVILGACNPRLALEAYKKSTDVALLIPCNIAVTEISNGKVKVEMMRPTQMLNMLPNLESNQLIEKAEQDLAQALSSLA